MALIETGAITVGHKVRSIVTAGAAAGLLTVFLLAPAAQAQTPPVGPPSAPPSPTPPAWIGTLSTSSPRLAFSGSVDNPTPLPLVDSPVPLVCAAECREFTFDAPTSAPFLVAIKSTVTGPSGTFNADNGFDLYLYGPSGNLVGAANGVGSNGQALSVSHPASGKYTIVVSFSYAEDPNAAYDGDVRLMASPTWSPPQATCGITVAGVKGCFELPALRALPAYDLAVSGLPPVASTPLGVPLPVSAPTPTSCYADESLGLDNPSPAAAEHPTLRCLRFTSDVQDVGAGALEVRLAWLAPSGGHGGGPQSGFVPGECQAEQVVTTTSGQSVARSAGACEYHLEHAHFHYKDLISFTLYKPATGGGIGQKVATSLKESFCLSDDDYFGFSSPGPNGPRNFVGQPGCNVPSQITVPATGAGAGGSGGAYVVEGISPGWGDVYTWDTPDQYIDITSVPPGSYDLVEETNPKGALLVSGPAQTCALTELALGASSVKLLSTEASISCPTQ
ncbi:MAG: hypothetical protein ACYCS7_02515 [Acidimicrobiales bacterium]